MAQMPHAPNAPPPPPFHHPPGMDPRMDPRMQEVDHLFGQVNIDPHQSPQFETIAPFTDPRRPSISRISTNSSIKSNGSSDVYYEGYDCERREPDFPGGKKLWSQMVKHPMLPDQVALASLVNRQEAKGPSVVKILKSTDMQGMKKEQVEKMVKERNLAEPDARYVWKPAYINTEVGRDSTGRRETRKMQVILKRVPRATAITAKSAQPMPRIVVNVNKAQAAHPLPGQQSPLDMAYPVPSSHSGRGIYNVSPGQQIMEIAPGLRGGGRPANYPQHGGGMPHGVEVMPEGFPSPQPSPKMGGPKYPQNPMPGRHGPPGHGPPGHGPPGHGPPGYGPPGYGPPGQGHDHHGGPPPGHGGHPVPGYGPGGPDHQHHDKGHGKFKDDKKSKKHEKPDVHHHHAKPKKDRIEDWRHSTGPNLSSSSDSDSDAIFDHGSDNDTVLFTPSSSVASDEHHRRDKRRSSGYDHRRKDSHHSRKHSDHRPRRQSSPPPPPPHSPKRQGPILPEGCVIMPAETFRDTIHGISRMNSTRYDRPLPARRGETYQYDGRRESFGRHAGMGLSRRDSLMGPRKVLERDYDGYEERGGRGDYEEPRYYRGERERGGGYYDGGRDYGYGYGGRR